MSDLRAARDYIDMMYGSPMKAVSSCLRGMITAAPGNKLIAVDFSQIEARVLAWLAGEESTLRVFRGHGKIYEHQAGSMYGVHPDHVTKDQRLVGKVACIAEGELVLTDKGLVPIEKIKTSHQVWDGCSWVSHEGVVFKGEKNVITYQGLTATEDHQVFTESLGKVSFGICSRKQVRIKETGSGGKRIWLGENNFSRSEVGWQERQSRTSLKIPTRAMPMQRLQFRKVDKLKKSAKRKISWVPKMFSTKESSRLAAKKSYCNEAALSKYKRSKLQKLWSTWDRVQVPVPTRRSFVGERESWIRPKAGAGQSGQLWPLRTRQFEVGNQKRKHDEYSCGKDIHGRPSLDRPKKPLWKKHHSSIAKIWFQQKTDIRKSKSGCEREEKKLEGDSKKARVYDIVNAGPHHRFTVSGCLVSNCLALGYQGGVKAFQSMAKNYYLKITDEQADEAKVKWREANPNIVAFWHRLEQAAISAHQNKGLKFHAGFKGRHVTFMQKGSFLLCKLPSSRVIIYPYPKMKVVTVPWGDKKNALNYKGDVKGKWFSRVAYGGLLAENITQAVARDLLACGMMRWEQNGYPIVMHVHDEIVSEVGIDSGKTLEEAEQLMCVVPSWAEGLPIGAEGWEGKRYQK